MDLLQQPSLQRRRIEKYLIFRFAIVLMALGLVAVYQVGIEPTRKEPAFRFLYTLLGTYLVFGLLSLISFARWGRKPWFLQSQVTVDFVVGALLTGATGGVASVFCPILFVALFSACNVVSLRGAIIFASLATTFLAVTTLGHAYGYFPVDSLEMPWAFKEHQFNFVLTYLIAVGLALHMVAILGSQISTGLIRVQKLHHEILENMCEGIIATDRDGRVLLLNSEARKIFGLRPDLVPVGARLEHVLDHALLPVRDALLHRDHWRSEVEINTDAGKSKSIEVTVTSVTDERGRLRCRIGLFTDLALKKEVQEAERRIRQLEELYEMSLGIAHEIRNPLASIRGCVQEIGRMQLDDSGCSRLVEIVCRESDRLDRIIEEFMCYTRKSSRPTDPIDVVEVVEATLILLRNHQSFQDRSIEFERATGKMQILGDREKIQQVVMNLGLNALFSTPPGTGVVRVVVRRQPLLQTDGAVTRGNETPGIELAVEDNGVGIAADKLDKIFTPFFTSRESGSGLGLAIVHRIVHDHGGTIRVRSEEGKGTRFSIVFPAHNAPADERETESDRESELEAVV